MKLNAFVTTKESLQNLVVLRKNDSLQIKVDKRKLSQNNWTCDSGAKANEESNKETKFAIDKIERRNAYLGPNFPKDNDNDR